MTKPHIEFFRRKALQAGAAGLLMQSAMAQTAAPVPLKVDASRAFGAVGISQFENIRLNAAEITGDGKLVAYDGDGKSRACAVGFALVDTEGNVLKQASAPLQSGHMLSLEITGVDIRSRVPVEQSRSTRVMVRPVVLLPPGPCKVVPSVELFDATTGRTVALLPAVQE